MSIVIKSIDLHVQNMRTRFPFQYGIASLVALPHLFVRLGADMGGVKVEGLAADGFPPKWFTKDPETHFTADLKGMLAVIRHAAEAALECGESETVFSAWEKIHGAQKAWAKSTPFPPLLWAFGVTLIERALIDAHCRCTSRSFAQSVGSNSLGIRLEAIHPELTGSSPRDRLPEKPRRSIHVRHTVGLADPLTHGDVPEDEPLNDGLPHTLEENIAAYGLTHLKIKLSGDAERDLARLKCIRGLIGDDNSCKFTLDGNEQYTQVGPFRTLWESILSDTDMSDFMKGLIFVEQPLHRAVALTDEARQAMKAWPDRPAMIIDESDDELDSSRRAMEGGYVGTSHKNCKGVFKGIANACLIAKRTEEDPAGRYILSSEDLANVGPVALAQDLAVLATLGVGHSERNGHHYFAGLSMFPQDLQGQVLEHHGTLYRRHPKGFPTLDISGGQLNIESVVGAPFGYDFDLDVTRFLPLSEWSADSLDL